jgi:hypothetical protein
MKTSVYNIGKIFLLLITFWCTQCELEDEMIAVPDLPNAVHPGIYQGANSNVLGTMVSTRVEFKENNKPVSLAIVIPMDLFKPMPSYKSTVYGNAGFQKFYLDLPQETIPGLLFDHVMIVYNPNGHAPGAFQFPQMNFSFYIKSRKLAESYNAQKLQDMMSELMPAEFIPIQAIPGWGEFWVRSNSPVLQDCFILHDMVSGSIDRNLAFYSPMASMELIKNNPQVTARIPLPPKVKQPGFYPSSYSIKQEGNDLVVSLENMVYLK